MVTVQSSCEQGNASKAGRVIFKPKSILNTVTLSRKKGMVADSSAVSKAR